MNHRVVPSLFILLLFAEQVRAGGTPNRNATEEELQLLFDLSRQKPDQSHFIADVEVLTPSWSEQQVEAEVKSQELIDQRIDKKQGRVPEPPSQKLIAARRAAITKATSGRRILHVEDWYYLAYHRRDLVDEGVDWAMGMKGLVSGYHESYVDINDRTFSNYTQFRRNFARRSMTVTASPASRFPDQQLWEIVSMSPVLAAPIWAALTDKDPTGAAMKPDPTATVDRFPYANLSKLTASPARISAIAAGQDGRWKIRAERVSDGNVPTLRFWVSGALPGIAGAEDQPVEAEYQIASVGTSRRLLKGVLTNHSTGETTTVARTDESNEGLGTTYSRSFVKNQTVIETAVIHYKLIEAGPTFNEKEVFLPTFEPGWAVTDLSTTIPRYLPGHEPRVTIRGKGVVRSLGDKKRDYIIVALAAVGCIPVFLLIWRRNGEKKGAAR